MTDTIINVAAENEQPAEPVDEQSVAEQLVAQARAKGINLVGPGGLLTRHRARVEAEADGHRFVDRWLCCRRRKTHPMSPPPMGVKIEPASTKAILDALRVKRLRTTATPATRLPRCAPTW